MNVIIDSFAKNSELCTVKMDGDIFWMERARQVARRGGWHCAPNPRVGCVITQSNQWVADGYHRGPGTDHAEVMACRGFNKKDGLKGHTVYVTLEPCAHFGRTPPCTLLLEHLNPDRVVIGLLDPDNQVRGKGVEQLKQKGIEVSTGVLANSIAMDIRHYLVQRTLNRPAIILKWAETENHFVDHSHPNSTLKITGIASDTLSHSWRAEVQAILAGTGTWIKDKPLLNLRHVFGLNPIRICLGKSRVTLPHDVLRFNQISDCLDTAKEQAWLSVLVEGGPSTHKQFIQEELWDELRIIRSPLNIEKGIPAAPIPENALLVDSYSLGQEKIYMYLNKSHVCLNY
jgi:diaminohydroxyphosphoribosylaminopyrimidine deaminase/5-amino-6-(5-phosphoribosylamino)uracil reductase